MASTTVALPPEKEATRPSGKGRVALDIINSGSTLVNPDGDEAQSAPVPPIIAKHWLRPEKTETLPREARVFAFCDWLERAQLSPALSRRCGFNGFRDLTDIEVDLALCVMAHRENLFASQQGSAHD